MSIFELILLVGGGIFAGFVNTLAGGGSFVSLALMMLMGLDANVANGTNRLAIIFQSLASSETFRAHQMLDLRKGKIPLVVTTVGSLVGAWVAVDLDKRILEKVLALMMLAMLFFIFYKPSLWLKGNPARYSKPSGVVEVLVFLAIGFYGGLIQAGIGYLLLAGLVLQMGFDLVKANALKVLITLVYSPFAFIIFLWHGQVSWVHAIPLAGGAVAGAFVASRMAVKRGAGFIRWVLAIMIGVTCLQAFGVINFSTLIRGWLGN